MSPIVPLRITTIGFLTALTLLVGIAAAGCSEGPSMQPSDGKQPATPRSDSDGSNREITITEALSIALQRSGAPPFDPDHEVVEIRKEAGVTCWHWVVSFRVIPGHPGGMYEIYISPWGRVEGIRPGI